MKFSFLFFQTFSLLAANCVSLGSGSVAEVPWNCTGGSPSGGGGKYPSDGDTAVISNAHTITVPRGHVWTIGTDLGTDLTAIPAIQAASDQGSGRLVIDGTLVFKGPVRQANAEWVITAGARVLHGGTRDSYSWAIGAANFQPNAVLRIRGESGPGRVLFANAPGARRAAGLGNIAKAWFGGGRIEAQYWDVEDWGFVYPWLRARLERSGDTISLYDVRFTRCSALELTAGAGAIVSFARLKVLSPTTGISVQLYGADLTAGHRSITESYIEGQTLFFQTGRYYLSFNVFAGTTVVPPVRANDAATVAANSNWLFNSVNATGSPSHIPAGNWSRSVLTRSAIRNPHFVSFRYAAVGTTIDGAVLQYEGTDTGGDGFQLETNPPLPRQFTVKRALVLPNANMTAASSSIVTVSAHGAVSNARISVEDNTFFGAVSLGGIVTGGIVVENSTTEGPLFVSVRRNLMWRHETGQGRVIGETGSPATSPNTYQGVDGNAYWKISGPRYVSGDKYTAPTTPGASDIEVDPHFVEPSRNIVQWARSRNHQADTVADVARLFRDGTLPLQDIGNMYRWITDGFAPLNTSASNHGAVAVANP